MDLKLQNDPVRETVFDQFEAFLYSRKFIFIVVLAGTIPMIMHSHQLFYNVSPYEGNPLWKNVYALFYATSFDLTILVFTIHVIKRKPILYACFTFTMNLLYFDPIEDLASGDYTRAFSKVFLSGVLSYTGYSYAELFVEKVVESKKKQNRRVYRPVNKKVNGPSKQERASFECPECKKEFRSVKALNGHMVAHRAK